jgi:general secretion pathway protein L
VSTSCTVVLSTYTDLYWQLDGEVGRGHWHDLAEALTARGDRKFDAILLPDGYSLHRVSYIEAERKMLAKTVPFSLEDELAEDLDDCHFALAEPVDGYVHVAVVRRSLLADLLAESAAHGLSMNSLKTCRPVEQEMWLQISETAAAFIGQDASVVVEQRQVASVIAAVGHADTSVYPLHTGLTVWPEWPLSVSNDSPFNVVSGGVELLQGDFRKGIAWPALWRQWRAPAMAAGMLLAVLVAQAWWQVGLLEARNLEYRQAIEKTYREAFPSGRVVNPRRQMEAKLAEIQGGSSSSGSNMLALLSALGAEPNASSLQVSAINYESRAAELRIDILADNFQQVEKLRSALRERGISAELQNSSASGNKVRAKLALKEVS